MWACTALNIHVLLFVGLTQPNGFLGEAKLKAIFIEAILGVGRWWILRVNRLSAGLSAGLHADVYTSSQPNISKGSATSEHSHSVNYKNCLTLPFICWTTGRYHTGLHISNMLHSLISHCAHRHTYESSNVGTAHIKCSLQVCLRLRPGNRLKSPHLQC